MIQMNNNKKTLTWRHDFDLTWYLFDLSGLVVQLNRVTASWNFFNKTVTFSPLNQLFAGIFYCVKYLYVFFLHICVCVWLCVCTTCVHGCPCTELCFWLCFLIVPILRGKWFSSIWEMCFMSRSHFCVVLTALLIF
jgi:hypothetical protein